MLGRMVVALTEEMGLPIKAGRSFTLRKHPKHRGVEPDNSYWIINEPKVRGMRKIDLKADPPPDLAIEVDCTTSSLDRMDENAVIRQFRQWVQERIRDGWK
jgi:Uma2 family endonuclease